MKNLGGLVIALILALVTLSLSAFTVDQREYAIVVRFGEIVSVEKNPGLHFKIPFFDSVKYFDRRIVTLDWEKADRINTSENKYILVDSFIKWRIIDPLQFWVSYKLGGEAAAEKRLSQVVVDGLNQEINKRPIQDVIAGDRSRIMENVRIKADADSRARGIEVIDVRLKRVDYAEEISVSVYQRMSSERERVAKDLRSQGAGAAEKIRADADKQREVIIAEAFREAQRIKGEGDAKAAEIYAAAYNRNPEFYAFYRSIEAYRNSLNSKADVMVLDPSSEFFKYLKNKNGK
jgi:membrane protease subunit HflC